MLIVEIVSGTEEGVLTKGGFSSPNSLEPLEFGSDSLLFSALRAGALDSLKSLESGHF